MVVNTYYVGKLPLTLEALSLEAREAYKAEAFEKMQVSKKADGIHQRFSTLYTLAVKGSSTE